MSEQVNTVSIPQSPRALKVINVALFVGILTLGGIASIAMKKQTVSVMENRKLAEFPKYADSSLWNGKYFRAIEGFYADNFPFRDQFMKVSDQFRNSLGFQTSEIKMYDEKNDAEANEKTDTLKKEGVKDGPLPDDGATGEVKKRVFVFKNRAFEMFGGGAAMGKSYADVINSYNRLGIPGLQVYNLIIPVALEFEITEKYKNMQKPNRPAIENIYNNEDSNIKKVWAIDEIRQHRAEYIYFNTDHHWTSLGAYYAYTSFCGAAGLTPVSLANVPSKVKPGFLGFFYRLTRAASLKANPDSVRYYLFPDSLDFYIGSNFKSTGRQEIFICASKRGHQQRCIQQSVPCLSSTG